MTVQLKPAVWEGIELSGTGFNQFKESYEQDAKGVISKVFKQLQSAKPSCGMVKAKIEVQGTFDGMSNKKLRKLVKRNLALEGVAYMGREGNVCTFQRTTPAGLAGVIAGYCETSSVSAKGVSYRGKPLREFEDVLGVEKNLNFFWTGNEEGDFFDRLQSQTTLPDALWKSLQSQQLGATPMQTLEIFGLLAAKHMPEKQSKDFEAQVVQFLAWLPSLVGVCIARHRSKEEDIMPCKPGEMQHYLGILKSYISGEKQLGTYLYAVLATHFFCHWDHGGGNASTFASRVTASTGADLASCWSTFVGTLSGPYHGGAAEETVEMLGEFLSAKKSVSEFIEDRLRQKKKIYGFGHRVLREEDPRFTILFDTAKVVAGDCLLIQAIEKWREQAPNILRKKLPRMQDPYPNVDFISGPLLASTGIEPRFAPVLFAFARSFGVFRQLLNAKQRGDRIYRPQFIAPPKELKVMKG